VRRAPLTTQPAAHPGRRFLVLSASMGSGHDAAAAALASRLTRAGHQVIRADLLDLLPSGLGGVLRSFYRGIIEHVPAVYAGIYAAFFRQGPGERPGTAPVAALAGPRLLALAARYRPDVIVSVFHLAAQTAGRLRDQGQLPVPCAVTVIDFAVHRQWLHAGNDLYLCLADRMTTLVRNALGRPAVTSGPLISDRFTRPPAAADVARWRRRLAAYGRPAVLLSTGAWGAASGVRQTARLLADAGYLPVVLCGGNERLRDRIARSRHTVALGWVDDIPGLMAAASAFIDNAAGQTAQEALAAGLPVVSYRPIPGHGAEGVRRMAELGVSENAADPEHLLRSLAELTTPGPPRDRRIAAGRALFAAGGIASLEALADGTAVAPHHAAEPRGFPLHGTGTRTQRPAWKAQL
jgi:UDP-N-acetylglucosamine:LPS N-acetylglucosamine transferase